MGVKKLNIKKWTLMAATIPKTVSAMNFSHRPLCSSNELLGLKVDEVEVCEWFLRQPFRRFHGRVDQPERECEREREAIEL